MSRLKPKFQAPCRLLLSAALIALLSCSAAEASQGHRFSENLGASGSGAGQLSLLFPELSLEGEKPISAGSGVAVNDETGEIYVADSANHRISQFDPSKAPAESFIRAFGADVGGAGVDVCTATCAPGTAGSAPGQLSTPTFIAVDNSAGPSHGAVYVADTAGSENRITKFDAQGKLQSTWGTGGQLDGSAATKGPFKEIKGIDTDPAGDLWVQGGPGGAWVFEFDQGGTFVKEWESPVRQQPTGIALDGAEPERLYALDGFPEGPIHRLTTTGADEGAVLRAQHFFTGIATNKLTHDLYADQQGVSIADVSAGCDPSEGLCTPLQVFGEGALKQGAGLGIDSSAGTVYAASTETNQIAVFPVSLEGISEAASNVKATTATVHGKVDPRQTPVTHCAFQYGESESYGQEVPCLDSSNAEVGSEANPINAPTDVHADIDPLNGGAGYHFRLRLGNEESEFLSSEDEAFTTLAIAVITEVKATEVTASSAKLSALVNPKGVAATTCQLEWGTSTSYTTTVPCQPQSLGSGSSPVEVSVELSGLSPDSTYHFNFSVKDENGTTLPVDHSFIFISEGPAEGACANKALREANDSTGLPDCRAYELVTPMAKNGALIGALLFGNIPPQIAEDGGRVIAPSIQCFAGALSCVGTRETEGEPFQFERSGGGWSTSALAIPASVYETSSAWGFNADSGAALFSAPSPPNNQDDWYVHNAGGSISNLGPLSETEHPVQTIINEPIVTTAGFSHVLWEETKPVWSFDAGEETARALYEYPGVESSSAEPQLVAVSGGAGSHDLIGTCGAAVAGAETRAQTYGSLSADGRTAYFQVTSCAHGSGANSSRAVPARELFARIDGEGPQARTVALSEPAGLSPAQQNPACTTSECLASTSNEASFRDAQFVGASSDGTMAYFLSPQQLTDDATQDANGNDSAFTSSCTQTQGANGCNLYLFEDPQQQPLSGTHLFDVSAGDKSGLGPEVQGMFALSSDGSHAYFVAKGVLTTGANPAGDHAVEGANNLYLYERDAAHAQGQIAFVARLADADNRWELGMVRANTTPDGRYLVFESHRGLSAGARLEGPSQIYRYDAQEGTLERISFGQEGFNDDGNGGGAGADASVAPSSNTIVLRYGPARSDPTMADDGSLVFFQSPVALTPGALSEVPVGSEGKLAQNIYEWEAEGKGSCEEVGGCIYLISDGKDTAEGGKTVPNAVELLGVDRSGENVFFATTSRLTPQDTDTQRDYYDVRIGGGFPLSAKPLLCEAEACHPGTSAPPPFGPLGSFSFSGPGNPAPTITPPVITPGPPTNAQKLAKALKACKAKKPKKRRLSCEKAARKKFAPKGKAKGKKKSAKAKKSRRQGKAPKPHASSR